MYVPTSAFEVLGDRSSSVKGAEAVGAIADYLARLASAVRRYERRLEASELQLSGARAEAVTRIREGLRERLLPGAQLLVRSVIEGKRAVDRYACELDRLQADERRIERGVEAQLSAIRRAVTALQSLEARLQLVVLRDWRTAPPRRVPDPLPGAELGAATPAQSAGRAGCAWSLAAEWSAAVRRWEHALEEIERLRRRWSELSGDCRAAEVQLARSLRRTELGALLRLSAASPGYAPAEAIALAVSGEHRGRAGEGTRSHPLLSALIGSPSGEGVWDAPPDPRQVAANWSRLTPAEQQRLITEAPWVIGNLPGLPFAVRDAANNRTLQFYRLNRTGLGRRSRAALNEIEKIRAQGGAPGMSVVALDLSGEVPKVAVGYGDLDRADHLTWEVPGMASDADEALQGWNEASLNLYTEQRGIIRDSGRTGKPGVIAFLEYDTPDLVTVLQPELARTGAVRLSRELDGTWATRNRAGNAPPGFRAPGAPTIGVVAHSYGTTTAADALTLTRVPVDAFTMAASAGLDTGRVKSLQSLRVATDIRGVANIYANHATADHLAPLGLYYGGRGNPNPNLRYAGRVNYLGAKHYGSDGYRAPEGPVFAATDGHSVIGEKIDGLANHHGVLNDVGFEASEGHGYWDRNTQSLRNLAATSLGMEEQIVGTWYASQR